MPMTAMAMGRRFVLTDITDTLRTPVLLTGTMARRGLAAESLSGLGRGIGMPIMAVAITDIVVTVMDAVMAMVVAMRMDVAAMAEDTAAATAADTATAAVSTVEAVMVAADTGNSAN